MTLRDRFRQEECWVVDKVDHVHARNRRHPGAKVYTAFQLPAAQEELARLNAGKEQPEYCLHKVRINYAEDTYFHTDSNSTRLFRRPMAVNW